MKRLFTYGLVLAAFIMPVLPYQPAGAVTQQDLINDAKCKSGQTSSCVGNAADPAAGGDCTNNNCNIVNKYLNPFIQFLSIMVGVSVVIGIILGGIQYAGSAGDPQKVTAAKRRIRNSVVALVIFIFLYALLNFLIPGQGLLVR